MRTKHTIKIKKRSQPEWLSWFIVVLPFLFGLLNTFLNLPWAVRYLIDVAWVLLVVIMLRYSRKIELKGTKGILLWTVLFFLYTLLVSVVEYQSGLYYLWGFRNNFRFYAAFFAFAVFLKALDIDEFFCVLDKVFWLNTAISLFQYFVLGLNQDILGGIFGVESGVNGYTNIFFSIILTRSLVMCFEKKESQKVCVSKFLTAFLIAALAELKFFFVEAIMIIVLAALFTNFSWRKFWIVAGGIAAVFSFAALLVVIFPNFAGFLSIDWFRESAMSDKGYTSSGDLNRLTAIPRINELWLTHWSQRIFGMGLGNCDTSSFAIVNTPFFEQWGHMHYTWMSYAIMYLECGWVGLIFYFGFFVLVYLQIQKIEKRSEGIARSYCRISKIMAILCPLIAVYNSSLRAESAYMAYFVLAIPFVYARSGKTKGIQMKKRENEIPLKG